MKRSPSTRLLIVAGVSCSAVAAVFGWVGVALGTPVIPGNPPAVATTLADVGVVNRVDIGGPVELDTKDGPTEIYSVSNTAGPGWSSGWHSHTGPVLVAVTAGSLTFYDKHCGKTVVPAGQGIIEPPNRPILAHNEGSTAAAWVATQLIPQGASKRVDVTPGRCGLL